MILLFEPPRLTSSLKKLIVHKEKCFFGTSTVMIKERLISQAITKSYLMYLIYRLDYDLYLSAPLAYMSAVSKNFMCIPPYQTGANL